MSALELSTAEGHVLSGLGRINVLLGKNGCGKSVLLRNVEAFYRDGKQSEIRYLVPERTGNLEYDYGVQQNLTLDPNWLPGQRRSNVVTAFMQQSVGQFARMETLVLRRIEKDVELRLNPKYNFDQYVARVNELLDHLEIRRTTTLAFALHRKADGASAGPSALSSGEAQLIALGIECLAFQLDEKARVENILLIDEPDVHIHPDLQMRLMKFLARIVAESTTSIVIATHSTAILGALEANPDARVCFMRSGDRALHFTPISHGLRKILPVFGAHPLSNVFNEMPLLLVEGSDEERIWQQAVRTSSGRIRLYPCECGGLPKMDAIEREADRIITSVYDDGVAYSLRDRDEGNGTIGDLGAVKRYRLQWRASENLLLTNDVLAHWRSSWTLMKEAITEWSAKTKRTKATQCSGSSSRRGFPEKVLTSRKYATLSRAF
jgi:energy-coupling factor transporter ATP-binding protein EcfA2